MIYSRRGDKKKTVLGKREYFKDSPLIEALGELDELICWLGITRAVLGKKRLKKTIFFLQQDLQRIAAILAGFEKGDFSWERVKFLERWIDKEGAKLVSQSGFIVPGEDYLSSLIHLSRAVSRRTERRVVALSRKTKISPAILAYLNRLSDFLFVFARLEEKGFKEE